MKTNIYILFITLFFGSCTSEEAINSEEVEIQKQELIADIEPVISYPIKITQRNLRETFPGSEVVYHKYDSVEITQLSDSTYYFQYFNEGRANPKVVDTLPLPKAIPPTHGALEPSSLKESIQYAYFGSKRGKKLFEVEVNGKTYKVIEKRSSCCSIWQPVGHIHRGSQSYFSLDFGMLGAFIMDESSHSKTLWLADWDQKVVDTIIQSLPLKYDSPYHNPALSKKANDPVE